MEDNFEGVYSGVLSWVSANAVWIGAISLLYFLVSLIVIRYLIVNMPAGYFMPDRPSAENPAVGLKHPVIRTALKIARNIGGVVVILIGLVMSIPGVAGQGFLTILLGLSLTDFPGKRTIELRLIRQPLIRKTISSIRGKAGKPPLELPGGEHARDLPHSSDRGTA
jgi:hypothetical protein